MPNKGIIRSQNRKTTTKLRILAGSEQMIRVDSEDTHPLADLDRKALLNHINDLSKECDAIIFEDYDKGTIHSEIISETISMAKKSGIPVVVDPRSTNFFSYAGATLFKPKIKDLETQFGNSVAIESEEGMREVIKALDKKIQAKSYLISLRGGDIYYHSDNISRMFSTYHTGVADMSGVGNTIISIAGLGLSIGLPARVIAQLSNIAKGIVSKYTGVVPVTKDQLIKEIQDNQILN